MVVGWNLYQGWYGSGFGGFGRFLDEHHSLLPDKPLLVTEYGAGHDPRMITDDPKRFDFSAEYSMLYHQNYVKEMEERDFGDTILSKRLTNDYSNPACFNLSESNLGSEVMTNTSWTALLPRAIILRPEVVS